MLVVLAAMSKVNIDVFRTHLMACAVQDPEFVNKLLGKNFHVMQGMGKAVLMPFLLARTTASLQLLRLS